MDSAPRRLARRLAFTAITYDYNPKTQDVTRRIALISAGGSWANSEGAANVMVEMEKKQAAAAAAARAKRKKNKTQNCLRSTRSAASTDSETNARAHACRLIDAEIPDVPVG